MKTIFIFSFSPDDWPGYLKTLTPLFEGTGIEIRCASLQDMEPLKESRDVIAVLASYYELTGSIEFYLPKTPVIWINHTLSRSMYSQLMKVCQKCCMSVASDSAYYSESRRQMLINLGLPQQSLRVWWPGMEEEELEDQVILFENPSIQNRKGKTFYYVENRGMLGPDTLIALLVTIDRLDLLVTKPFQDYFDSVCFKARKYSDFMNIRDYYVEAQDKGIRNGLIMFSGQEAVIHYCDTNALSLINKTSGQVYGKTIYEVLPILESCREKISRPGQEISIYDGVRLALDVWSVSTHGFYNGYVLLVDEEAESRKELRLRRLKIEKKQRARYTFSQIIGISPEIRRCKEIAKKMAKSAASVLITGPSGSGKELFAQAIHNASSRREYPFISVNCGALVESLLESELFGYEGGAFTGAKKEGKPGFFELAHRGTLFLDEIGEMPLQLQVKLLRVLQEREVVRVGGRSAIPIDVRIIAATNRDLAALVEEGKFRLDLYFRLNVLPLELPGLNGRRADIPLLFQTMCREYGLQLAVDQEARERIQNHDYRGNVRELRNCVEYLGSLGKSEITAEDLPPYMKHSALQREKNEDSGQESSIREKTDEGRRGYGQTADSRQMVLWAIGEINAAGIGAGRRSIASFLNEHGSSLSERQVRGILQELEKEQLIVVRQGRGGIHLKK